MSRKLYNDLMAEAERRGKMGHYAPAHDLRRAAQQVSSAESLLEYSKKVKATRAS